MNTCSSSLLFLDSLPSRSATEEPASNKDSCSLSDSWASLAGVLDPSAVRAGGLGALFFGFAAMERFALYFTTHLDVLWPFVLDFSPSFARACHGIQRKHKLSCN